MNQKLETEIICNMERAALARWCKGDPSGFLEISADDVVYFDPCIERRLDGLPALREKYEELRGKVFAESFELINPKVQICGEAAVLTFNYVSRNGSDISRWNCTEVYSHSSGNWLIIQTHWSLTAPSLSK